MSLSDEELVCRIEQGDDQAAEVLFDRFVDRLVELTARRLSPQLARRVDPEDVVQSACRSFFRRARAGEYDERTTDDLWSLLAAITVNKTRKAVRYHTAQKRSVYSEDGTTSLLLYAKIAPEFLAQGPSPEEAAMLQEETIAMMRRRSPLHRKILEYHLQGHADDETARMASCSQRTVRRALDLARDDLARRLSASCDKRP